MIFIKHRINTISKLIKVNKNQGVEFDVRSYKKELIVNHEPFKKSLLLSNYLKFFDHKFAIVNIKEEGIEKKIVNLLNRFKIKNYFLLDVTVPQIYKIIKSKKNIPFAIRVSKFESPQNLKYFTKKIKWVWLDTFDGKLPISIKELKIIKKKYKICLVSPELISNNLFLLSRLKKKIGKKYLLFDAICTKKPNLWSN